MRSRARSAHRRAAVLGATSVLLARSATAQQGPTASPTQEEPTEPSGATAAKPSRVEPPPPEAKDPSLTPGAARPVEPPPGGLELTPLGYVEALYAYNLNRPSNGITNYRGFDNRHNTFTLSNVALGVNAEAGPVAARLILQYGSTPSTYYLGEPSVPGSGGANSSNLELWKYVQEANVAWKAPVGRGLLLQLGLVPSPIGYETFAVKDNWNWSRSNLFFGLPFYHTGLRATYEWTDALSTAFAVYNGWNSVVDNNEAKSIQASVTYKAPQKALVQALYFGGVERSPGSLEGPHWRHHFDVFGQLDATTWVSLAGQADYGYENNRLGTARWWAGAAYARVKPVEKVYVALRGDRFTEHLATDGSGRASNALFWGGASWVSSFTATLDLRPVDHLSVRLEYRHDVAEAPLYFGRNVAGNGSAAAPYAPNARMQDTMLLGATAWF